jgi:hypothetical protein
MPAPPSAALTAWTPDRHRQLHDCHRSLFWTLFGWRGLGLDRGDPEEVADGRQAASLRHAVTLPTLVDRAVHQAMRALVTAARDRRCRPELEDLVVGARLMLNQVWRASQVDLLPRFWRYPGSQAVLQELLLRPALTPGELASARDLLRACLHHAADADLLEDLANTDSTAIEVGFSYPAAVHLADGGLALVSPDVVYLHGEPATADRLVDRPTWCIVDVATHDAGEDEERLLLAAGAIQARSAGRPSSGGAYLGRVLDLVAGVDRWYRLDASALALAEATMGAERAQLRRLMADPDAAIPRLKREWEMAQHGATCERCPFFSLCQPEMLADVVSAVPRVRPPFADVVATEDIERRAGGARD